MAVVLGPPYQAQWPELAHSSVCLSAGKTDLIPIANEKPDVDCDRSLPGIDLGTLRVNIVARSRPNVIR